MCSYDQKCFVIYIHNFRIAMHLFIFYSFVQQLVMKGPILLFLCVKGISFVSVHIIYIKEHSLGNLFHVGDILYYSSALHIFFSWLKKKYFERSVLYVLNRLDSFWYKCFFFFFLIHCIAFLLVPQWPSTSSLLKMYDDILASIKSDYLNPMYVCFIWL